MNFFGFHGKSSYFYVIFEITYLQRFQAYCEKLNIIRKFIFIPAILAYKYQLVDVCFAPNFKKFYTQGWTAWFVKQLQKVTMKKKESTGQKFWITLIQNRRRFFLGILQYTRFIELLILKKNTVWEAKKTYNSVPWSNKE